MSTKAIGSRAQVMHGTVKHTSGGLVASDLAYDKKGKIISKEKSKLAKKNLGGWISAVKEAKKELDIYKGDDFTHHILRKGSKLYKLSKEIYGSSRRRSKSKSKSCRRSKSKSKSRRRSKSKSKSRRRSKSKKSHRRSKSKSHRRSK